MDKVEQISRKQFSAREMERRSASQRAGVANAIRWAHDDSGGQRAQQRSLAGARRRRGARRRGRRRTGALSLADALTATGLPDPGPVTTYGLPFFRAAGEIAAVVAVGSFLFAAFLVPPQANGVLDAGGYRASAARHRRLGGLDRLRGAAWCR